jgi:hypothetical protein
MLCHLPVPFPDELLYSVIARYIIRVGTKKAVTVASNIFGRKTPPQVDTPSSLGKVSQHTFPIWHMTGEEIVNQLTLFPYYTRYLPSDRIEHCLEALLSNDASGIHLSMGVITSRVKVHRFLRFCRACRRSDLSRYGETYWHRTHQLAGVLVCPEHREILIPTRALMRPLGWTDYVDATLSTAEVTLENNLNITKHDLAIALKVAKRCQEMLFGSISYLRSEDESTAYRRAAMERGFVERANALSQPKIEKAFVSFFGETLLSRLGCKVDLVNNPVG